MGWRAKLERVRTNVAKLREKGWYDLASLYGSFFAEPMEALRLAWWAVRPDRRIDPKRLTVSQQGARPILCVHGKFGTRGQFGPLAQAFALSSLSHRPLFSISLKERGRLTASDYEAMWGRIEEILLLYPEEVRGSIEIDIIGYSRGAEVAALAAFEGIRVEGYHRYAVEGELCSREQIGKVILIGSPLSGRLPAETEVPPTLFEIDGEWDILVDRRSRLEGEQSYTVPECGHCALLLSDECIDQILRWLEE